MRNWLVGLLLGFGGCVVPSLEVGSSSDGYAGGSGVAGTDGTAGTDDSTPEAGAGGSPASGGSSATGGSGATTNGAGLGNGGNGAVSSDGGAGGAEMPACPKPSGQICHEFVVTDNGRHNVSYVNEFTSEQPGAVVWRKAVGPTSPNSPRSIEIVASEMAKAGSAVLVSLDDGFAELDVIDGEQLVRATTAFTGIKGACRLPDGNTAVGTNTHVYVVSSEGSQVSSFVLPAGPEMRGLKRNSSTGNFWFTKNESIYEVTAAGALVEERAGIGTDVQAVYWRNGGSFASWGDIGTVVEMIDGGGVYNTVGGKTDHPFIHFTAGFAVIGNRHVVIANWLGNLTVPGQNTPHLFEVNFGNDLVWQWGDQDLARQVIDVHVVR